MLDAKRPSRLMSFFSTRIFGVVLAPVATVYSRFFLSAIVASLIACVQRLTGLERRLRALVEVAVSVQNGCAFCADLHAFDQKSVLNETDLNAIVNGTLECFSDKERVAIEASLMWLDGRNAKPTETALRKYFSDDEIVRLVWLTAAVSFFNLQGKTLMLSSHRLSKIEFRNATAH